MGTYNDQTMNLLFQYHRDTILLFTVLRTDEMKNQNIQFLLRTMHEIQTHKKLSFQCIVTVELSGYKYMEKDMKNQSNGNFSLLHGTNMREHDIKIH